MFTCGRGALWEWEGTGVGYCTRGFGLGCDASCRRWGSSTLTKVKNLRFYCHRNPRTCRKRRLLWGEAWGLGTLTSVFYSSEMSSQRKGVKPPQSLNIFVFNVHGYSTNEEKKGEIGKMFFRRRFEVCTLSETKLKGKGEVVGKVSGMAGRAREGVVLLLSARLMRCVGEWKEVSSRLMWVRVKIESWVFISAYGPGGEKSEEKEDFWNELNECVGSFGRNESGIAW